MGFEIPYMNLGLRFAEGVEVQGLEFEVQSRLNHLTPKTLKPFLARKAEAFRHTYLQGRPGLGAPTIDILKGER